MGKPQKKVGYALASELLSNASDQKQPFVLALNSKDACRVLIHKMGPLDIAFFIYSVCNEHPIVKSYLSAMDTLAPSQTPRRPSVKGKTSKRKGK